MRFERISGLSEEQIDELEQRVPQSLQKPWTNNSRRPRRLTLREALIITCGYLRQNIIEEAWADIFSVSQPTISRCIALLTPLVKKATARDQPAATGAAKALKGAIALVDGMLWPCWSWKGKKKLWSGKHKTTGHGSLIITDLHGRVRYISGPVTGNRHGSACSVIFGGVFHHAGTVGRVAGRDPEGRSYESFKDPNGNHWMLQEIITRLPSQ